MQLMYHKDAATPVNVANGNVKTMERRGWTTEKPVEKTKDKPKTAKVK